MDPSVALVFRAINGLAMAAWLALLLSPPSARWHAAVVRASGRVVPLLLSLVYVAMLALHWRGEGGFGSIGQVRALFDVPGVLVAGWAHYLAFDLFVGAWISERAARERIAHWQVVPCLLLTFWLGPVGYLTFAALRLRKRQAALASAAGERS